MKGPGTAGPFRFDGVGLGSLPTLGLMASVLPSVAVAARPRAFVGVRGPQAADYLQRMVSNDVEALGVGESCDALLLTAEGSAHCAASGLAALGGRLPAPHRARARGDRAGAPRPVSVCCPGRDRARGAHVAGRLRRRRGDPDERLRASPTTGFAGGPRRASLRPSGCATTSSSGFGSRPGRRAGVRSSTSASCRPRPGSSSARSASRRAAIRARSRSRGSTTAGTRTAGLRRLRIEGETPPERDAELVLDGKTVGRVTSAVPADGAVLALGYVRTEVPADAELTVGDAVARPLH